MWRAFAQQEFQDVRGHRLRELFLVSILALRLEWVCQASNLISMRQLQNGLEASQDISPAVSFLAQLGQVRHLDLIRWAAARAVLFLGLEGGFSPIPEMPISDYQLGAGSLPDSHLCCRNWGHKICRIGFIGV